MNRTMITIIQFTLISVSFPNFPGKVLGKTDYLIKIFGKFPGKHKIFNFPGKFPGKSGK